MKSFQCPTWPLIAPCSHLLSVPLTYCILTTPASRFSLNVAVTFPTPGPCAGCSLGLELLPPLPLWLGSNVTCSERPSLTTHLKLQHREFKMPCVILVSFATASITFQDTAYLLIDFSAVWLVSPECQQQEERGFCVVLSVHPVSGTQSFVGSVNESPDGEFKIVFFPVFLTASLLFKIALLGFQECSVSQSGCRLHGVYRS